jgi:hypothetical protein
MRTRLNELSVRERGRDAGGSVIAVHYGSDSETLAGKGLALVLVHGYNNSHDAARAAFEQFILDLEDATGFTPLPWPVFGVQWPGDESNPVASAACYPFKVAVAETAATRIIDHLATLFGPGGAPLTLCIVGHSLGCRVIADLLAGLAARPTPINVVVDRVALMAAAVPVAHVDSGGDLRRGIQATRGVCILYSTSDTVLHYAFPPGQTAARDGWFPTAVGRFGDPASAWTRRQPMAGEKGGYGHGDYWPGAESAAAVAAFLGSAVAARTPTSAVASHSLPAENAIGSRTTPATKPLV